MAIANTLARVVLEPASQAFVEATATPPFLYELTPDEARKVLDDVQAAPIDKLPVDEHWITVPADVGDVRVRIVRPPGAAGHAAGDPVHARRRLGARQRRDARPARPRARRRRQARRSRSSSTTALRRRATRSRSSRATPSPSTSCERAPPTASTPTGWPSPATRSGAA